MPTVFGTLRYVGSSRNLSLMKKDVDIYTSPIVHSMLYIQESIISSQYNPEKPVQKAITHNLL